MQTFISAHLSTHHYRWVTTADFKAEPYDFTAIIDSKLSNIKMESFGREWLYNRLYEWITPPAPPRQTQSIAVTAATKITSHTGEPVRSISSDPVEVSTDV